MYDPLQKSVAMRKLTMPELNRLSQEAFKAAEKLPLILVLDNIRSALNVGSIFRTADAFAVETIVLCGITAKPPHREMLKTALGATESVAWRYFNRTEEALQVLKEQDTCIVAVEQTDESVRLQDFVPEAGKKYALILGNEVRGVSEEALPYCDVAIEIPQFGTKHSLNVAVCAGVVVWEFMKKTGKC